MFFTLVKGKWMNLMGSNLVNLDVLTILIAYLFLFYGNTATATFAFGQGLFMDLFSGGLHGLFTLLYLGVYGGIILGYRFFDLQGPKGQMIIISLAVLMKELLFLIMLAVFYQNMTFSKDFFVISGVLAIVTGLIAPLLFYVFDCLRAESPEDARNFLSKRL
jgi:cell shape-determining protein MreD